MGASKQEAQANARHEASARAADRLLTKLGTRLEQLDRYATEGFSDQMFVTEIRLKARYDDEGDVLAIIKADGEEGDVIAFHSDDTISAALSGLVNRLNNGTLKWREDKPYGTT